MFRLNELALVLDSSRIFSLLVRSSFPCFFDKISTSCCMLWSCGQVLSETGSCGLVSASEQKNLLGVLCWCETIEAKVLMVTHLQEMFRSVEAIITLSYVLHILDLEF